MRWKDGEAVVLHIEPDLISGSACLDLDILALIGHVEVPIMTSLSSSSF